MASTSAVALMRGTHLKENDIVRSTGMSISSHELSSSGSPKPVFDMIRDGWVSSFDEEGNFLEVSFEASPDNKSVLLMGRSGSEAELNQHFFPRMSVGTNALSSIAPPRISTLKNPISTFKNPISRFTKKVTEETRSLEKQEAAVSVSSGKKRRRNRKLSTSISKMASKAVHSKRTSAAPPNVEQDPRESNKAPSKKTRRAKKLKKKIMQRISKKGPLLRISKIGRKSSAEGAFPSVARKEHWEALSVDSSADSISPRELDEVNELGVASSMDRQRNNEVPANSTDETSDTSCADSTEEIFTPNMAETTVLYHDQRIPVKWGMQDAAGGDNQKKSLALDLGEPTDESRNNKASTDGDKSTSEASKGMHMQEQLDAFNADETLSCDVEDLMNSILEEGESRQRSHSACYRSECAEFADLKISCSHSTGGIAERRGSSAGSMSVASTATNEWLSPTSTTAPVFTLAQVTTPLNTIVIRKTRLDQAPPKSPKPMLSDTKKQPPPRSPPARRTPSSANKNGSASRKQFNYRANRAATLSPTRLQMDQAPSSPIGDLVRKPRRRHSLKKAIQRGIRSHPVVSTTVALSAALFFIRNIVQ